MMSNGTTEFRTAHLPLAAFILTGQQLRFLRCQRMSADRVEFIFDDPHGCGEQLGLSFECGAECPATSFYDSIRRLRKIMDATLRGNTVNMGVGRDGYKKH